MSQDDMNCIRDLEREQKERTDRIDATVFIGCVSAVVGILMAAMMYIPTI